jgi:hypothetical protein
MFQHIAEFYNSLYVDRSRLLLLCTNFATERLTHFWSALHVAMEVGLSHPERFTLELGV